MTTLFEQRDAQAAAAPQSGTAFPADQLTLAPLVRQASPAVVNIAVLQASPHLQNPLLRDPYYRLFMGVPDEALAPRVSAGSGFIVDASRWLVVTNHHVIAHARAIAGRSEERRVGKEGVSTCSSRWSP